MNFNLFQHEDIATQPLFYLFVAFSALLGFGFFWGKKTNTRIFRAAFEDLVSVVQPVDQTFTNIGGLIGYHAELLTRGNDPVERVEATITFLPRQSWLWLPVSKLIRKYDRLFITLHLRFRPLAEGHLIEAGYAGFRGPKITNVERLQAEKIQWGAFAFILYSGDEKIREKLHAFARSNPDPGSIRHIAIVPEQKKCFIFMIPTKGRVAAFLAPIYRWVPTLLKQRDR